MSHARASALAPSSKLALYLAAVISIYLIGDPKATLIAGASVLGLAMIMLRSAGRPVPAGRWRVVTVFILWVFLMRAALDLVVGVPVTDPDLWLVAARQAMRVAVIAIGVLVLIAVTTPREIVEELEESRLPRSARILVMMLVQYPRVLRDRFEQIIEAQVARGADRPRSVVQRVGHGAALLLPVMQSELNAIGERATLIHLRGLDHPAIAYREGGTRRRDLAVRLLAVAMIVVVLAARLLS